MAITTLLSLPPSECSHAGSICAETAAAVPPGKMNDFRGSRSALNRSISCSIASTIEDALNGYLKDAPFDVVRLAVGNIDYPPVVSQAVEKKLAAKQLLEEKDTQREIAQRDAEIRIEEAKGIAEAQKIINATLTPNYLQHEAIEAQKTMASAPNHTTVYIPVGPNGLPLVHTR